MDDPPVVIEPASPASYLSTDTASVPLPVVQSAEMAPSVEIEVTPKRRRRKGLVYGARPLPASLHTSVASPVELEWKLDHKQRNLALATAAIVLHTTIFTSWALLFVWTLS